MQGSSNILSDRIDKERKSLDIAVSKCGIVFMLILFNCMSDFTTRFLAHEVKYQKDLDCADYIHHYLKWI